MICSHWDAQAFTCTYNKKLAMEFLNSVGAIVQNEPTRDSVDPNKEWSSEDWNRYSDMMAKLASEANLNLPTGKIGCGEYDQGVNQFCNQWDCEGRKVFENVKKENPNSFVYIKPKR